MVKNHIMQKIFRMGVDASWAKFCVGKPFWVLLKAMAICTILARLARRQVVRSTRLCSTIQIEENFFYRHQNLGCLTRI
jgi:hypothetical protein